MPYAHPSCNAQRTPLNVHCTLARVPTVCQNTADDNDNDTRGRDHDTNVREHISVTVVLSKQATHAPRLKAHTTATSAAAIKCPFSLKCRDVLLAAPRHMTDAQKVHKKWKSLRRDPIRSCCDQCEWYCAACCWNSERQTSMNRKKNNRHWHTHMPTHRTPTRVRDERPCAFGSRGATERAPHTRNGPRQTHETPKKLNSWLVWGLSQRGGDRETGQA